MWIWVDLDMDLEMDLEVRGGYVHLRSPMSWKNGPSKKCTRFYLLVMVMMTGMTEEEGEET